MLPPHPEIPIAPGSALWCFAVGEGGKGGTVFLIDAKAPPCYRQNQHSLSFAEQRQFYRQ